MSFNSGSRVGPYEILGLLGAGGMGEVYRARDMKLGREVAVKVLPAGVASDANTLARFEREAQLLAALNHPNIASIYGLQENAIVMELVDGPTLAERVQEGALPLDEAVAIARQIAEALEVAHDKGIIHRDLKPANIKLTPAGQVKVLDFGLAKALAGPTAATAASASQSPTITAAATRAGVILGTAAYMSPEQARGRAVDKRADIWAFGCILYEMLSGRQSFLGETASDSMAAILRTEPELGLLPAATRRVVRRCLEKDPARRYRDIGDVRIDLEEALAASPEETQAGPATKPNRTRTAVLAGAGVALIAAGAWFAAYRSRTAVPASEIIRFELTPQSGGGGLAISPDGTRFAWTMAGVLWGRTISEMQPRRLYTGNLGNPEFSWDGSLIAATFSNTLLQIPFDGGPSSVVATDVALGAARPAWAPDGSLFIRPLAGTGGGLKRIPVGGGQASTFGASALEQAGDVHVLPGGEWMLAGTRRGQTSDGVGKIIAYSLSTGVAKDLLNNANRPAYVESGHLIYEVSSSNSLFGVAFEAATQTVRGSPVRLLGDVRSWDVSHNGTLVYATSSNLRETTLVQADRSGKATELYRFELPFNQLSLSRDGKRMLMARNSSQSDIWGYDIERRVATRLTTTPGEDETPVWSPDGTQFAFAESPGGSRAISIKSADGSAARTVWRGNRHTHVTDWSPDGKTLLMSSADSDSGIHMVNIDTQKAEPWLVTPFLETDAKFSPDGKWVAYNSNEAGRAEIYVRAFQGGGKWQLSAGGGTEPMWSPTGREVFYRRGADMMAVSINTASGFSPGAPHVLFTGSIARRFAITSDGKFIGFKDESEAFAPAYVVVNWSEELKRRIPTEK